MAYPKIAAPLSLIAVLSATSVLNPIAMAALAAPPDGFVKWTEPKEHSFSVEVPRGWKVTGGMIRAGKTDTRQFLQVESPEKDAVVQMGDPGLPTFCTLSAFDQQQGYTEGKARTIFGNFTEVYLHYMTGTEFNRWYIQNRLSQAVEGIEVVSEKDASQVAQNLTASARKTAPAGSSPQVSVGLTEFKGISKETGKPVGGLVMTMTHLSNANSGEYGATWTALPMVMGGTNQANGQADPVVLKKIQAAMTRMLSTRRVDPVWDAKEGKRIAQVTKESIARNNAETARAIAQIKDAGERSRAIARSSDAVRQSSMNAYWQRNAARAENQHQFIGFIRDEKDATDRNGNPLYDRNGDHIVVPNR